MSIVGSGESTETPWGGVRTGKKLGLCCIQGGVSMEFGKVQVGAGSIVYVHCFAEFVLGVTVEDSAVYANCDIISTTISVMQQT
jgi:hypothetical protein